MGAITARGLGLGLGLGKRLLGPQPTAGGFARVTSDATFQHVLRMMYRELVAEQRPLPPWGTVGFKVMSQTDEDGFLWYLLSVIGVETCISVELCAGTGEECNTANLLVNHGWHGLLVDGDSENVSRGTQLYCADPRTRVFPPVFECAWLTRDNINDVVETAGFTGTVDVLSLDVDGVDWWLWDALEVIVPRIVVVEYQDILGPTRSWTVPYSDDFRADAYPMPGGFPSFAGASLNAFIKLGRRKGYRFVGSNTLGYNAFFVREDLADALGPAADPAASFEHPKVRQGMKTRFPAVADLPWEEV